ncbi:hypothetical protein V5O48_010103, partial [Marasmius crinis-equi]
MKHTVADQLGTMDRKLPPDTCSDQVARGTFQKYLIGDRTDGKFCSPNINTTLPSTVQLEACKEGIKTIANATYNTFWPNGDWYNNYYIKQATQGIQSLGEKVFAQCPPNSTVSKAPTPSTFSISKPISTVTRSQSESDRRGLSTGAVAGISVGVAVVIVIA